MKSVAPCPDKPLPHVPLETVLQRVKQISTLPHVALHVMRLANDPDIGARDLKQAVESDPSLSARVLRCVNSSAYALRSKVGNLQQAISLLGFNQVRNLAITSSVSECFKADHVIGPYRKSELWRHMVAVAVCARLVATRCKLVNFEDAFLAGLLHDIGIIIEDQHVHPEFAAMIRHLKPGDSLIDMEATWLGFDHAALGARLADIWKFPLTVREAIRCHHRPETAEGSLASVVHCVAVANLACNLKGIMSVGVKAVDLPRISLERLGMDKDDLKLLVTDLDHEMESHQSLFAQ